MDMYRANHKYDDRKRFFSLYRDESSDDDCMNKHDKKDHHESCVKNVLKAIHHAQKEIKKQTMEHHSGCKSCFDDLFAEKKIDTKKNTIPFILFCEDGKPFKATGVKSYTCEQTKLNKFACLSSFIFKIKDITADCAILELLVFKNDHHTHSPCCQVNHKDVKHLVRSGVCVTVDLSCFCAISCLPAVCLHKLIKS